MESGEQERWALFYQTGLPQAYTYWKECQRQRQTNQTTETEPRSGARQ